MTCHIQHIALIEEGLHSKRLPITYFNLCWHYFNTTYNFSNKIIKVCISASYLQFIYALAYDNDFSMYNCVCTWRLLFFLMWLQAQLQEQYKQYYIIKRTPYFQDLRKVLASPNE